jgi:hypothetical protein
MTRSDCWTSEASFCKQLGDLGLVGQQREGLVEPLLQALDLYPVAGEVARDSLLLDQLGVEPGDLGVVLYDLDVERLDGQEVRSDQEQQQHQHHHSDTLGERELGDTGDQVIHGCRLRPSSSRRT